MLARIMDAMFGCRHSHYSFPITIRTGAHHAMNTARTGTYVVCLDCGRELSYDWQEMHVATTLPEKSARPLVTKEAA